MIFDKTSIRPNLNSQSINTVLISDNKVTLGFPSFYFPYISWIDDSPAIPSPKPVITLSPSSSLPVLPNLPSNSNTNKDDVNIFFNSENEVNLPLLSFRQSLALQTQQRLAGLETKPMPDYYNREKTSTTKTNSSIPFGSPHSKPCQAFFQYALAHIPA